MTEFTKFPPAPDVSAPRFEFLFEIELRFDRMQMIANMPAGAGRGATYVAEGEVRGPHLNGRLVPNGGGDWALFRPDGTLNLDARYMIEADDGGLILIHNRGYLAQNTPDTLSRIQDWMFRDGPEVPVSDYYLRTAPMFETSEGPHDWLTRYIVVGLGTRQRHGNTIRYFALL